MIDFHSHILPGIDDGSSSLEMSIEMLKMEARQGITHVVATPHFYAQSDKLDAFLQRRDEAYRALQEEMKKHPGLPEVILGAEVSFFRGISESEFLNKLTIHRNRCLLIELPPMPWDASVYRELEAIWIRREVLPILAHIDRYLTPWNSRRTLQQLSRLPVILQANAEFFLNRRTAKMAMAMLKKQQIQLLGSDCHNMSSRRPNLDQAVERIVQKLGADSLSIISEYEHKVLNDLP